MAAVQAVAAEAKTCARAGARQLPGRWQGYSGVNVGVVVDRCQPVWTVTAGLEGMTWRSAGRRAACWLLRLSRCLAVTATLATPYIPATQCF